MLTREWERLGRRRVLHGETNMEVFREISFELAHVEFEEDRRPVLYFGDVRVYGRTIDRRSGMQRFYQVMVDYDGEEFRIKQLNFFGDKVLPEQRVRATTDVVLEGNKLLVRLSDYAEHMYMRIRIFMAEERRG